MLQSLKQPYEAIYISGFALTYYKKNCDSKLKLSATFGHS